MNESAIWWREILASDITPTKCASNVNQNQTGKVGGGGESERGDEMERGGPQSTPTRGGIVQVT